MNQLQKSIQDYLAVRRELGFKLRDAGIDLSKFAYFMNARGATHITTNLAMEWVQQSTSVLPSTCAERLGNIRNFARYYLTIDPRTEIPAPGLLPFRKQRARPYLYSDEEITQLLRCARELPSRDGSGLRSWIYYCLIGLLSVTGLRIGEAIRLQLQDVNLQDGLLTIRGTKFGKSRLVPLHRSTQVVLAEYLAFRSRFVAKRNASTFFFITNRGNHLDIGDIHRTFYKLSQQVGLRAVDASHGPRLHDFRHRFAVQTLLRWYQSGEDAERRMPVLSTFLGHVHVADTYWYLSACPELMAQAVVRLERRWEQRP